MIRTISTGALALALLGTGMAMAQQGGAIPDAPMPHATLPVVPAVAPANASPEPAQQPADTTKTVIQSPAGAQPPTAVNVPPPGEGVQAAVNLYKLAPVRVTIVQVPFTVKDSKGNLVSGLLPNDVRILENGVPQRMTTFMVDPFPLSVALVIDQSMAFNDMEKVNAALGAVQGAFAPYDEVAVFTYNNGPRKWTDFTGAQSDRLKAAVEVSRSTGRDGFVPFETGPLTNNINKNNGADMYTDPNENSSHGRNLNNMQNPEKEIHTLYDAIMAAAQELTRVGRGRRRVIYVISNGNEYGSKVKEKDLIHFLQSHEITVYATLVHDIPNLHIPFSGFLLSRHLPFQMKDNVLPRFANATGGLVDPELTTHGIIQSLNRIAETARTQYTAFYTSSEPPLDGKYRSIDVRILGRPNLDVIAKPGYYPTADRAPATADPTPPPSADAR